MKAYLVDVLEFRKDKKSASGKLDDAVSTAQHLIELNDNSSDAHSLLAELLGRKIGYSGMFAGPKLGPKVKQENKRALVLDYRNPRAWASLGRQYLMGSRYVRRRRQQSHRKFSEIVRSRSSKR